MSASDILIEMAARAGWDEDSQIELLCRYIDNQQDDACFAEFLERQIEEEEDLSNATKHYVAKFKPEMWFKDHAVEVDPQGPTTWDCTAFLLRGLDNIDHRDYLTSLMAELNDGFGSTTDDTDYFVNDLNAPEWVRKWAGPFTITISLKEGDSG